MGSGAVALAFYIKATGRSFRALLPYAWPLAFLGLVNTAVPFFLIAWGQQYIDSGLAAVFNASAPLFTAVFAIAYDQSQRVSGMRLAGVVLGFSGVVLLVGFEVSGGERAVAGGLAVVGAGACYALGGLYAGRRFPGLQPSLVAFGTLVWSTLYVAPLRRGAGELAGLGGGRLGALPRRRRDRRRVPPLLRADRRCGRLEGRARHLPRTLARAVYGAVFLDEHVTALALAGLALVLAGVALGTGSVRR